jgi:hypothetical protein
MKLLQSRKLWITIGAIFLVLGGILHGDISYGQALDKIVPIVWGYLGAQGAVDTMSAYKKTS